MNPSLALATLLLLIFNCFASNAQQKPHNLIAKEYKTRPEYHFTPPINWINDPNGLVYHKGQYHLYYQFNPFGNKWGHMSWGHASSKNLIVWKHHPVAIPEKDTTMIYSGSAIYDEQDKGNFKKNGIIPLHAFYTGHSNKIEVQYHALSYDDGTTFQLAEGIKQPILDFNNKDFRDPKIIRYKDEFRMLVSLANEHTLKTYASTDLRSWTPQADIHLPGPYFNGWECPDLIPVVDEKGKEHWALILSVNYRNIYFLGKYDGNQFTPYEEISKAKPAKQLQYLDYGPDFFAAVSWNNLPKENQPTMIAWANNWEYAGMVLQYPFRGIMNLPFTPFVWKNEKGAYRLGRKPAINLGNWTEVKANSTNKNEVILKQSAYYQFKIKKSKLPNWEFFRHKASKNIIKLIATNDSLGIDRSQYKNPDFPQNKFSHRWVAAADWFQNAPEEMEVKMFIDNGIIEIFLDGGKATFSTLYFQKEGDQLTMSLEGIAANSLQQFIPVGKTKPKNKLKPE